MRDLIGSIVLFFIIGVVGILTYIRHKPKINYIDDVKLRDLSVYLMWIGLIGTMILF
jgi:hypothetical protein